MKARRWIAAALGAVLLAACDAPTVERDEPLYSPTSLTGGVLYRWPLGRTVAVWVAPAEGTVGSELVDAVQRGIDAWAPIPRFREVRLVTVTSPDIADVIIYDVSQPIPVTVGPCPFTGAGASGYTYLCPAGVTPVDSAFTLPLRSGGGGRSKIVIRVDRSRVPSAERYAAVVAHELGHALGIGGHSDAPTDLMFAFPTVGVPSARDAATLRHVLGRTPTLRL